MENLLASVTAFDFAKIFGNLQKRWYYYIALLVVVAIVIVVTLLQKNRRNNLNPTQKIVYTAVMSALCFLANYYTIKVSDVLQISLVATVGFLSGYMLGSGLGFASAFIGDLICGIVAPFGAYNPIIGIGTGLWGFIPGVLFNNLRINQIITAIISFILCFIINSFLVNTLGLSLMYSMTFESLLVLLPTKLLVVAINAVISILLMLTLRKILPKHKFHLY